MFFERLSKLFGRRRKSSPKYIPLPMKALEGTVQPIVPEASPATETPDVVPNHVAIIMDGNGRWAKKRGLPRSAGHAAGTEALRDIIRASDDWGVKSLTIYAFSTENWVRSKDEIDVLMGLLLKYFSSEIDELDEKNVHIRILGDIDGLPQPQREAVTKAMERTRENTGLNLNIALNYGSRAEILRAVRRCAEAEQSEVLVISAQIEEEISQLPDDEKAMFLEDMGITESGVSRLARLGYDLLGLISFLPAGPKEVRAWTIVNGTKAPQAAGKIHTDFERGFIRANVIAFEDLKACGSEAAAREKGLLRAEGKEYVMRDGDVVHFLFNV